MKSEVLYSVERTVVTVAFLAAFVVLTVTGHMIGVIQGGFVAGLGLILNAWFAAATGAQSMFSQLLTPPPAAPAAPPAQQPTPPAGTAGGAK